MTKRLIRGWVYIQSLIRDIIHIRGTLGDKSRPQQNDAIITVLPGDVIHIKGIAFCKPRPLRSLLPNVKQKNPSILNFFLFFRKLEKIYFWWNFY